MVKTPISKCTILTVIVLSMATVTFAVVFALNFTNPANVVKQKIESIASDYYENYFYPQLTANQTTQSSTALSQKLERYTTSGFAKVSLRQLLLFDNERHVESANFLRKYCNENKTFVQIFPESPFHANNYHINYHYSCEF